MRRPFPLLRIASVLEAVSLVVLLGNLVTVHHPAVSSVAGPVHGCAYVMAFVAVLMEPGTPRRAVALALVPGAGGMLALRALLRARGADGEGQGAEPLNARR